MKKNLFLLKFPVASFADSPYHPTPSCTVERHAAFLFRTGLGIAFE